MPVDLNVVLVTTLNHLHENVMEEQLLLLFLSPPWQELLLLHFRDPWLLFWVGRFAVWHGGCEGNVPKDGCCCRRRRRMHSRHHRRRRRRY